MRKIYFAIAILFSAPSWAQYVGMYPLYDMYQGNPEEKECWNTFLIDTIGNTNQPESEISKLSIEVSILGKNGKAKSNDALELTHIDHRFVVGLLANPTCSDSFAITKITALDESGNPIAVEISIFTKNDLISKNIKLKNAVK